MNGMLTEEQKRQMNNMALTNIGLSLMQPVRRDMGMGAHVGNALGAGYQVTQQYPQQAWQEMQMQMQVEDFKRKQADAKRKQEALGSLTPEQRRNATLGVPMDKVLGITDPYTLSEGQTRYSGSDGSVLAQGPEKQTDFQRNMRLAGIDPSSPQGQALIASRLRKEATHAPPSSTVVMGSPNFFTDPDTGQTFAVQTSNRAGVGPQITPLPKNLQQSSADKPPTDGERTASGYTRRMIEAENTLSTLPQESQMPGIGEYIVGGVSDTAANFMRGADRQQSRQAQEDWVRAKLRKESGAVIGEEEMAREISTYFPMPGDGPKVVEQKARSRRIAIQAMESSSGRASGGLPKLDVTPKPQSNARPSLDSFQR